MPLFPAGHREDLRRMVWRDKQFFGPRQIECRERRIEMKIQRGFGSCLTVIQPGELFAVAEEKLDLEAGPVELHQLAPVQVQIGRGQDHEARRGRIFSINQDHHPQLVLEGDMPDQGCIEMDMGSLRQRAQSLKAVQVLKGDLTVILAFGPAGICRKFSPQELSAMLLN